MTLIHIAMEIGILHEVLFESSYTGGSHFSHSFHSHQEKEKEKEKRTEISCLTFIYFHFSFQVFSLLL
jgi:hypothetical protein